MIVLDASILIAYLDSEDDHHETAEQLLAAVIDEDLAANPLTLAEALVVPVRIGRLHEVQAVLRDLEVSELPFPTNAAVRLAQLRAATGLRMPDCCVLLAAQDVGATVESFDERLARAAQDISLPVLQA